MYCAKSYIYKLNVIKLNTQSGRTLNVIKNKQRSFTVIECKKTKTKKTLKAYETVQ